MRLLWRIFLPFLACAILALAASAWYASRSFREVYKEEVAENLTTRARILIRELDPHLRDSEWNEVDRQCKEFGSLTGSRVTVVLPDGTVVGDSDTPPSAMENHGDRPEIAEALAGRTGKAVRFSDTTQRTLMYLAVPVAGDTGVLAAVRASLPLSVIDWFTGNVSRHIAMGFFLVIILFALLAYYLARLISQPLENMRQAAERLAQGDFQVRVPVPRGRELNSLARALNEMAVQMANRMGTITRQANQQQAVFSSMVEGVLAVGSDGRILDLNPAAAHLLDVVQDHARGRSIQETVRNPDLQKFLMATLAGENPAELAIVLHGKEDRHLQLRGAALTDQDGRKMGALIVLNDITRVKRLETMRQDFVANVSHELRTPITALMGCVETLAEGRRGTGLADEERFIAMMGRQVERLNAIVEDLLSLSRIEHEARHGSIPLSSFPVREILRRAGCAFAKAAAAKGMTVAVECPDELHATINAALLEQAVGNLIDNAIKYSGDNTRIIVSGAIGDGTIEIRIEDQGPGIEQRHIGRIFERFYRVDQPRSRVLGGTGLGLSIVKHIVLAHGGEIAVESTPGKGSVFIIRIPRA